MGFNPFQSRHYQSGTSAISEDPDEMLLYAFCFDKNNIQDKNTLFYTNDNL